MWRIFQTVVATGTTYVFSQDTGRDDALAYFVGPGIASWVAEDEGRVVAMYKLVANRRDRGSHVANASFMVDPDHAGLGVGKAIGLHCLREARRAGFLAMQFNFRRQHEYESRRPLAEARLRDRRQGAESLPAQRTGAGGCSRDVSLSGRHRIERRHRMSRSTL